ncbi:MAG: restriction endonuclease subunit S [Synechocystis sp.]|jgi:type I restriction enzyme S subunit
MKWEVKKLGDVCQLVGGGTPSKSNLDFYLGSIPWATVRDMKEEI